MKTIMNGKTKKSNILRLVVFLFISILPVLAIIHGIILLCNGWLPNLPLLLSLFVFPLIIITCCFIILRANVLPIILKIVLCIVIMGVSTYFSFINYTFGMFYHIESYDSSTAIVKYEEDYDKKTALPNSKDINNYVSLEYHIFKSRNIIADPYAQTLICKYNSEDYKTEKDKINKSYIFQKDKIGSTEPEVNINHYEFKMLSDDTYYSFFPKYVGFIGFNDEANEIVYIYFNDIELDYIMSTKEFINEECGFKYIR